MCGIIGIVGASPVLPRLLKALEVLEYRGYDSAGLALWDATHESLGIWRAVGRLEALKASLPQGLLGTCGMGHTRWATHGKPEERNAHPQSSRNLAMVHNGILENYGALKAKLVEKGYHFVSDTDTEVLAHFLDNLWEENGGDVVQTMAGVFQKLEGALAFLCMVKSLPGVLLAARRGSNPLVVGRGQEAMLISSDALGLVGLAQDIAYVPDKAWVRLRQHEVEAFDEQGNPVVLTWQKNPMGDYSVEKEGFPHFMLKEIHEQPGLFRRYIQDYHQVHQGPLWEMAAVPSVTFMGCGTAFYASWIGKYFWESLVGTPAIMELASEFHSHPSVMFSQVTVAVSQSGETADTLKSAEIAKNKGQFLVAVVNVPQSALARMAHHVVLLEAGPEIGVASTKAFTAQMWMLLKMALSMAPQGVRTPALKQAVEQLPQVLEGVLKLSPIIQTLAQSFGHHNHMLYMGRGLAYPLALEGALKMKELSYIHAEGMASGELKHGSLALVHEGMPVLFLLPSGGCFHKSLSNVQEVASRGGRITLMTDETGAKAVEAAGVPWENLVILPDTGCPDILSPFVYALALQLLAYYTAAALGHPVDNPRNLAKSVTVY